MGGRGPACSPRRPGGRRPYADGRRPSAIGHRPSAVGCRLSAIRCRPSAMRCRPSAVRRQPQRPGPPPGNQSVHLARSQCAAALGWRSRVNTPFRLPPTRCTICERGEVGEIPDTCSPTTASHTVKEHGGRSRGAPLGTPRSRMLAPGVACRPDIVSAPYSVTMMGLPCFACPRPELRLQGTALRRDEVARLHVPAVVAVDHDDVGQLGHRARVGEGELMFDEADRASAESCLSGRSEQRARSRCRPLHRYGDSGSLARLHSTTQGWFLSQHAISSSMARSMHLLGHVG